MTINAKHTRERKKSMERTFVKMRLSIESVSIMSHIIQHKLAFTAQVTGIFCIQIDY